MLEFQIVFYEKENQENPVEKIISGLDMKIQAKIVG